MATFVTILSTAVLMESVRYNFKEEFPTKTGRPLWENTIKAGNNLKSKLNPAQTTYVQYTNQTKLIQILCGGVQTKPVWTCFTHQTDPIHSPISVSICRLKPWTRKNQSAEATRGGGRLESSSCREGKVASRWRHGCGSSGRQRQDLRLAATSPSPRG
jgi:hypothetical protein